MGCQSQPTAHRSKSLPLPPSCLPPHNTVKGFTSHLLKKWFIYFIKFWEVTLVNKVMYVSSVQICMCTSSVYLHKWGQIYGDKRRLDFGWWTLMTRLGQREPLCPGYSACKSASFPGVDLQPLEEQSYFFSLGCYSGMTWARNGWERWGVTQRQLR